MAWFGQKQKLTQVFLILNFITDGYKQHSDMTGVGLGEMFLSIFVMIFHVKN